MMRLYISCSFTSNSYSFVSNTLIFIVILICLLFAYTKIADLMAGYVLYPGAELNCRLSLRRTLFYPLNYQGLCGPPPLWLRGEPTSCNHSINGTDAKIVRLAI